MQIAIDGPAGSGKSTIAKILAEKMGFIYLDTGAMYRSAAYLKSLYNLDYATLYNVLESTVFNFTNNGRRLSLSYEYDSRQNRDVTSEIRTPEITAQVSEVSADPRIRSILTDRQREIAAGSSIVMDGRDIGTVVLPCADLKIFLNASQEIRAQRRFLEWLQKDSKLTYEKVLEDVIERDRYDSSREIAPLKRASDSIEIDTSDLTIDEVTAIIYAIAKKIQSISQEN